MGSPSQDDKQFFKIGEAAEIVGVKAHVLRYWESEFPQLRPMKTRGAHRMYRREDVALACRIRRLLGDEGLTVAGAVKRLRAERGESEDAVACGREVALRAELLAVRAELQEALAGMERPPEIDPRPPETATVTSVRQARVVVPSRKAP